MSGKTKIEIGGLGEAVNEILKAYGQDVTKKIKRAVDKTSKDLKAAVEADAPHKRGTYRGTFRVKKDRDTATSKVNILYNARPGHQIAHLLEKGHRKRRSGTVAARPHIRPNAEKAQKEFEKKVEEIIEEAGKK